MRDVDAGGGEVGALVATERMARPIRYEGDVASVGSQKNRFLHASGPEPTTATD